MRCLLLLLQQTAFATSGLEPLPATVCTAPAVPVTLAIAAPADLTVQRGGGVEPMLTSVATLILCCCCT
jgi:hypothetical protein